MALRDFTVRAPATTANLGPGFDAFGLAFNLWSEVDFSFDCERTTISAEGFGAGLDSRPETNLILTAFKELCRESGVEPPRAFRLRCRNRIPFGSGLGSSAAAIACGLVAANEALDLGIEAAELVDLGSRIEGHPDNIAAALLGGLTVGAMGDREEGALIASYSVDDWNVAVIKPHITIFTEDARRALPKTVAMEDAVFNIQRIAFLLSALCGGDEDTLGFAMQDRLHQEYRLPLIPGGREILDAAIGAGAAGVAVSGSGPALVAFSMKPVDGILAAMADTCLAAGINCDQFNLKVSRDGASVIA